MNILQQTAGSIGTATMSVVLTGQVLASPAATACNAVAQGAVPVSRVPDPVLAAGRSALAGAFGHTFLVALVLIVCCLVPPIRDVRRPGTRSITLRLSVRHRVRSSRPIAAGWPAP